MPRWARFLSCTITGLLLSLIGFFMVAYWREGGPEFWPNVFDFLATAAFWGLAWLFVILSALTLVLARVGVKIYGLGAAVSGILSGLLVALAYASFLIASHAPDWGGLAASIIKVWPSAVAFSVPLALSGAMTDLLWERLA